MKMLEKNLPDTAKVSVYHQHTDNGRLDSTVAVVFDRETGDTLGVGRALVNHRKEKSPSRKMGRQIAVGRAMRSAFGGVKMLPKLDNEDELVYSDIQDAVDRIDWEAWALGTLDPFLTD